MNQQVDTNSIIGMITSVTLVGLGELAGFVGSMELQDVSYVASITIVVETLIGSPVKRTFGKIWKKLLDGDR